MVRPVAGDDHYDGLDGQMHDEADERDTDQAQSLALAPFASAGQLPKHDRAGPDLDQRAEPEACQRNRARSYSAKARTAIPTTFQASVPASRA